MVNGDTGASAGRLKDTRGCHDGLACFSRTEEANRDRARVAKEFQIKVMPVLERRMEVERECRACQCYDTAPRYRRMRCPSDEDPGRVGLGRVGSGDLNELS